MNPADQIFDAKIKRVKKTRLINVCVQPSLKVYGVIQQTKIIDNTILYYIKKTLNTNATCSVMRPLLKLQLKDLVVHEV